MCVEDLLRRVAYIGGGRLVCRECAVRAYVEAGGKEEALAEVSWDEDDDLVYELTGLLAVSRLGAEGVWRADEMTCDECGTRIIEPRTEED